jgi:DNA polymerase-2
MTPPFLLYGRWHIDLHNSFIYDDAELLGLLEVSRVAKVPVQRQSRLSTGVSITSMQMDEATRMGALIPWKKAEVEEAKTLAELITVDKGGMVYLPPMGLHENVASIDFASMYPALMVAYNISPETVNCDCCPKGAVPEAGYSLCRRREGLVPRVLRPLLEKRLRYKALKKTSAGEARKRYDLLQSALRWCLWLPGVQECPVGTDYGPRVGDEFRARDVAEGPGYCGSLRVPGHPRHCGLDLPAEAGPD